MSESHFVIRLPKIEPQIVIQSLSEVYDWGAMSLQIPEIHKQTMGEGVTVAVIDSGKSNHFEVQNNIAGAKNVSASDTVDDKAGHSTFVSGVIAAEINNEGIIGVAPKAKIYFIKAIDDSGCGDPARLVEAILLAANQKVNIISISAGMFIDFKPLHEAIKFAYNNNITIVSAAGNSGTRNYDIAFPARYPEVIGVAAYDSKQKVAPFSSRGINISFSLPGVDIYSTYLDNSYCKMSGTSFACPILSGICALILSKHKKLKNNTTPCDTPKQVLEHLVKYAVNLGPKEEYGFGTVDVKSMLTLDDPTNGNGNGSTKSSSTFCNSPTGNTATNWLEEYRKRRRR